MATTQQQTGIDSLGLVTVVVEDLDEAIEFYTDTLGFELRSDDEFEFEGETGRWVTIGLPDQDVDVTFAEADAPYYDDERRDLMQAKLGIESGFIFYTADCEGTVEEFAAAGVEITQEPLEYEWGTEAMFADPFGNEHSLFELAEY